MTIQNSPVVAGQDQQEQLNSSINDAVFRLGAMPPVEFNPLADSTRCWDAKTGKKSNVVIYRAKDGVNHVVKDFKSGKAIFCNSAGTSETMDSECLAAIEAGHLEALQAKWNEAAFAARRRMAVVDTMPEPYRLKQDFPYLIKKKLPLEIVLSSGAGIDDGVLYVPLFGGHQNKLVSYQSINRDGDKRFLKGSQVAGAFSLVGDLELLKIENREAAQKLKPTILICEGWATAITLNESTGYPVVAAMSAGNLLPVAKTVRRHYPMGNLVICGDDDRFSSRNTGRLKATEAALEVGARVCFPAFPQGNAGTDFNDVISLEASV